MPESPCSECEYWTLCENSPRASISTWRHGLTIARSILGDPDAQAELKEAYASEDVDPRHIDESLICVRRRLEGCQNG